MAQLRLAVEKDERRRSTGTWDAANATCLTLLLTSPTYCGSFLIGSLKVPQMKEKPHLYSYSYTLWINFCQIHDMMLKYSARYEGVFQLANVSHFIGPLSLTLHDHTECPQQWSRKKENKKIIFKHFCQFSRWPRRRAKSGVVNLSIAATSAFSICGKFQTKLFGFSFSL